MKILIKIHRSPAQWFLVELQNKDLIKEVARLLGKGRNSKAIVTALSKGKVLKEVKETETPRIAADLLLSEEHAYHDLT